LRSEGRAFLFNAAAHVGAEGCRMRRCSKSHTVVTLWPITDANREAVEALAVAPDQGRFVSGVRESILEATEEPDARALYWAI
jgi:hypothetical protein